MPRAVPDTVTANWSKLFEGLQTSPKDFYTTLEIAIDKRAIPGLETSRVDWNEGGVLSPRREYLRVQAGRQFFDICAAPFGNGFFFSWWLVGKSARFVVLYLFLWAAGSGLLAIILGGAIRGVADTVPNRLLNLLFTFVAAVAGPVILWPVCALIGLWVIAVLARGGIDGPEAAIESVPVLGWIYHRLFNPVTYYRLDTMQMFRDTVHSAVLETIDAVTATKGVRALSETERKPIYRELIR